MVHKHRNQRKATLAKDVSPMRSADCTKYAMSASPADRCGLFLRPAAVTAAPMAMASKWMFNEMVQNNRDQFNSLHLC